MNEKKYLWGLKEAGACAYCGDAVLTYYTTSVNAVGGLIDREEGDNLCKGKYHKPIVSSLASVPSEAVAVDPVTLGIDPDRCFDVDQESELLLQTNGAH
jgi:hypothetical protein